MKIRKESHSVGEQFKKSRFMIVFFRTRKNTGRKSGKNSKKDRKRRILHRKNQQIAAQGCIIWG